MTILVPILVLGLLVFFHELGHFLVAKRAGVHIHELAFGMGPRVLGVRRGETLYSLRALPFGGFVRMASVADPENQEDAPVDPQRTFESRPLWRRIGVISAGPAMNFVLAVVLLFGVFGIIGVDQPVPESTVIGAVVVGSPAAEAGLLPGDRIVSVNGSSVDDWQSLVAVLQTSLGRTIEVSFERDGVVSQVSVTPAPHPQDATMGYLGIASSTVRRHLPLGAAFVAAVTETGRMLGMWISAIANLFRGQGTPDVTGPIGIIQMLGEASRFGLASLFYLAAVISANFGLINLLPVPALDGSRLIFFGIEAVRGRPVPPEQEGRVHMIGYGLLMALLVLLTYRDLARLGGGGP